MIKEKLDKIKNKQLSALDNVKSYLDKIKKEDKKINSFLYIDEKGALEQAKKVDEKIKKGKSGKLAGLVIGIKASINVKGMPISCASKTLEDYNGTFDATVIKRIKEEDGIIIGINNCDEFCCGISGENSAFGNTENPAAPGHVPGGSSSGPAAAIAAEFCDITLGSDTGGSIRNPASNCGIYGIKPSYGRVSRHGLIDMSMSSDSIGPLSNDVFGCALMLNTIAGYDKNDAVTFDKPVPDYTKFRKLKINIGMSSDFEKLCTDKKVYTLIKEKAEQIAKELNTKITDVPMKYIDLAVQTYYPIIYVEMFSASRKLDGRKYGKNIEETCGEEVLRRILGGREISRAEHHGKYYRKALQVKKLITQDLKKAFEKVDIIILPTNPTLPQKFGELNNPKTAYAADAFTIPASLSGICGGVIPAGKIDSLPVGLQILAPAFKEDLLLNIMKIFENLNT